MARAAKLDVPARIVVVAPPAGVSFALQRGKRELAATVLSTGADLQFDFAIQVQHGTKDPLRFSGEFVQGPAGGKFVYVNSGTLAGQETTPWTRRAKVSLQLLGWPMILRVTSHSGTRLEARIAGTSRDGGPACGSVPLLAGGWSITAA